MMKIVDDGFLTGANILSSPKKLMKIQ